MPMKYPFTIEEVSKDDALAMVRRYHYSDTLPRINRHFLGCFLDEELVGVVTLGLGTRPKHTIKKVFPSLDTADYCEIGRMCMTDDMPRNSESQMLSDVVHWIRANERGVKVLFTWADGIMGKPGYVYQACSFLYTGFIETDMYLVNGVKMHPRGIKALYPDDPRVLAQKTARPTLEQMREFGIEHYRGRQFRYLRFTCPKCERKRLMSEALVPVGYDYPKDKDLQWKRRSTNDGKWQVCDQPIVRTDYHDELTRREQLTLF